MKYEVGYKLKGATYCLFNMLHLLFCKEIFKLDIDKHIVFPQ